MANYSVIYSLTTPGPTIALNRVKEFRRSG